MPHTVILYSRPGCCLCDDARRSLLQVRHAHPFELQERDIEQDDGLLRRYLERIPVVEVDGIEAFEYFVDEQELIKRLTAPAPATPSGDRPIGQGRVKRG